MFISRYISGFVPGLISLSLLSNKLTVLATSKQERECGAIKSVDERDPQNCLAEVLLLVFVF